MQIRFVFTTAGSDYGELLYNWTHPYLPIIGDNFNVGEFFHPNEIPDREEMDGLFFWKVIDRAWTKDGDTVMIITLYGEWHIFNTNNIT